MDGKELVKLLKDHGWTLDHISGSHYIMVKTGMRAVPVPVHGAKDIPKGLTNRIMKQAGVKRKAF
jgi:predicted RNA binding protein YcfA (HicA-like mRNA interferase family)